MQALYDGEESAIISIHFDHGKVPEIKIKDRITDSEYGCVKEIEFGDFRIQIFEREELCLNSEENMRNTATN